MTLKTSATAFPLDAPASIPVLVDNSYTFHDISSCQWPRQRYEQV